MPGITHVRNQVAINYGNTYMVDEAYVNTACMLQAATDLYYKHSKLASIGF